MVIGSCGGPYGQVELLSLVGKEDNNEVSLCIQYKCVSAFPLSLHPFSSCHACHIVSLVYRFAVSVFLPRYLWICFSAVPAETIDLRI